MVRQRQITHRLATAADEAIIKAALRDWRDNGANWVGACYPQGDVWIDDFSVQGSLEQNGDLAFLAFDQAKLVGIMWGTRGEELVRDVVERFMIIDIWIARDFVALKAVALRYFDELERQGILNLRANLTPGCWAETASLRYNWEDKETTPTRLVRSGTLAATRAAVEADAL